MNDRPTSWQQTWTVRQWGTVDGGILGATIVCVVCLDNHADRVLCQMCDGDGELHQPYQLPNGAAIDLDRDAALLIQIESPIAEVPKEEQSDD